MIGVKSMRIKPIISEKSLKAAKEGDFTFAIGKKTRKPEIKAAIKRLFGVKVVGIRTAVMAGKKFRRGRGRSYGEREEGKKAIVRLANGQSIELFEKGEK